MQNRLTTVVIGLLVLVAFHTGLSSVTPTIASSDSFDIDTFEYVPTAPVAGHPRLWLRAEDLPRLRSWAVDSNPLYRDGLAVLAAQAKADMDAGRVPGQDTGDTSWEEYPTEMYAQLFAFMSLISSDQATRDDYAGRARTLLMHVMNEAVKGPAEGQLFRDPRFSTYNRSRWWGEAFALTADWIYPYLTDTDKATIRQVFLRWVNENLNATTVDYNHPEPIGVVNDPVLISDPIRVRWAANNYYTAHMRNIGLMAMALDPADDPGNELRNYLGNATGAWLYVVDHLLRTDAQGGLTPEGFEYSPQSMAYVAQFLLALHTAGQDDPAAWGPQVVLSDNPFWDDVVTAYFHSLSPATATYVWPGEVYQPAWYGDGENYWAPDFIGVFGPLGLYHYATGNTARLEALRWIQTHMPPGGADAFIERVGDAEVFRDAILYFMLFDPAAPSPTDPRPAQPLTFYASGIGRLFARTGWGTNATWFTYALGWNTISHQHSDGNQFEFYRQGEWLTKEWTGYGGYGDHIQTSDYHNTLALENDEPLHSDPGDYRTIHWQRGSQWLYEPSADGQILAYRFGQGFVYALGDATGLYNSDYEGATDITHASRSIVWLKPDHIVVYDRAASQTAGRFKRFWLNLPAQAVVSGTVASMTTTSGQQLFIKTLLPADAVITSVLAEDVDDEAANEEPMQYRLRVEAPGGPQNVGFLHVLQGADAGADADPVTLVQSTGGTPFAGARVDSTLVLFPVNLDTPFSSLTYTTPAGTARHLITGLTPNGGYDVVTQTVGSDIQVTISTGTTYQADSGGVLIWEPSVSPCPDFNGDGSVDTEDLQTIAALWRTATIDPRFDRDGDGRVTVRDVMLVAVRWGESCRDTGTPMSLADVTYWAYQIQDISEPGAVDALTNSHYGMLVLEPTRTDWSSDDKYFDTQGMVTRLKNSLAGDGVHRKLVLAYIDIGEAEDWRWYWTWSTDWDCAGDPPADWPDWIITCDPDGWTGNYPVAYWDPGWKDIVIYGQNTGSHPDRNYTSVIDEVIKDGFDGIYLDWVEAFEDDDVAAAAQAAGKDPAVEMITFIQEMRQYATARNPDFLIIQQNAASLVDGHPELTNVIDAIAQEAIWYDGDATDDWDDPVGHDWVNDASLVNYYIDTLEQYLDAGLPVFDCEYALTYANTAYAKAINRGYVPYVTRRALSQLTTTPPPGYGSTPPSLSAVNDFLYQLQNLDLTAIGDTAYDLVVMDYSADGDDATAFTAAQINALKHSPGGEKIVLAYMSIGEAEDYRFYWNSAWDDEPPLGVPDTDAPAWLDIENPDWEGNYKVHYWDPGWQTRVFSYTDRLLEAGFDGAYLDIIDAYEYYADQGRATAAQEMAGFVAAIRARARARDSDFYIFPQNAPELADLVPAYLNSVDGIGQEDIYYGYEDDDVMTPPAVTAELEGYLDVFKNAGKLVLTTDYATTPAHIGDAYAKSQAQGYVPFVTVRDLDQLTINPGHEPD